MFFAFFSEHTEDYRLQFKQIVGSYYAHLLSDNWIRQDLDYASHHPFCAFSFLGYFGLYALQTITSES